MQKKRPCIQYFARASDQLDLRLENVFPLLMPFLIVEQSGDEYLPDADHGALVDVKFGVMMRIGRLNVRVLSAYVEKCTGSFLDVVGEVFASHARRDFHDFFVAPDLFGDIK